jgi:hypothetical protein
VIKTADGLIKPRKCIKRRRDKPQMGSSSSIGGNRPEGETSHCRVKHTHTPASTINKKRLRLTADLFIPAASIDRFSQSLSIKVLEQTNKTDPKGSFFLILYFSDCFSILLGNDQHPPLLTSCTGGPLFCFDVMSGCFSRRVWTR